MSSPFPPEVADAHRRLSVHHAQFAEFVCQRSSWLKRSAYRLLERGDSLAPFPLQSWPLFIDRTASRHMSQLAAGLMDRIRQIPQRFFDGDPGRIAAFYGLENSERAELLLGPPNGIESAVARGDFVWGPEGPRCLEMNVTGHLGGWQSSVWASRYLQLPMVVQFLAQHSLAQHGPGQHGPGQHSLAQHGPGQHSLAQHGPGQHSPGQHSLAQHSLAQHGPGQHSLAQHAPGQHGLPSHVEPLQALFAHMADCAARRGCVDRLSVAFLVSSTDMPNIDAMASFVEQQARRASDQLGRRIRTVFCSSAALEIRGTILEVSGWGPVDAILEARQEPTPAIAFRAFKARQIDLYDGPIRQLLGDKRNLALLSAAQDEAVSVAERQWIHQAIPWTRQVQDQMTSNRKGQKIELLEEILREQQSLVLKKAVSGQGADVCLGDRTESAAWGQTLDRAVREGDWIVQEFVPSLPVALQSGARGWAVHDLVWGIFAFGSHPGGGFLSAHPRGKSGVVNVHQGACSGVFLEVEPSGSSASATGSWPGV